MRNDESRAGGHIGVLDLKGASCPSCAFTIERAGRRVAGVRDVRVDVATHEIRVQYDGNPEALRGIEAIVSRLGYQAEVKDPGAQRPQPDPQ
jgi:copper chaperone CopZ